MNLENNIDLIQFINTEKKKMNIFTHTKILNYFCKCFIKTIIEIDEKFKDLDNYKESVIIGCNVMFNVFWILFNYTYNLTLTIFLSERSILLFTEFIILSRDPKINKEMCYMPNISDAMSFAYKKTIGPIQISNISNTTKKINASKNSCFIIKYICFYLYKKTDKTGDELLQYLTKSITKISSLLIKLNKMFENEEYFIHVLKKLIVLINNKSTDECIYMFLEQLISIKSMKMIIQKNKIMVL